MIKKLIFCLGLFFCRNVVAEVVPPEQLIFNYEMLDNKAYTFAVQDNSYEELFTRENFPNARKQPFDTYREAIQAVAEKKVDAFILPSFFEYKVLKKYPTVAVLPTLVAINKKTGITVGKNRPDLLNKFNQFIADILVSGEYDKMASYWLVENHDDMPKIKDPEHPTETITAVLEQGFFPMSFFNEKGKHVGLYVEFIKKFALFANVKVNIVIDNVEQAQEKMKTGEAQVFVSNIKETKARAEYMLFTEGFLDENFEMLVRKDRLAVLDQFDLFSEKKIGTLPGLVAPLTGTIPLARVVLYDDNDHMFNALQNREIDGALLGYDLALKYLRKYPGYAPFPAEIGADEYTFAVRKNEEAWANQMSFLLRQYVKEGWFINRKEIWFGSDESLKVSLPVPNGNKKVKVGYIPNAYPFSYVNEKGDVQGLAVDLLYHYFDDLGYGVSELKPYDYKTIFEALEQGEIDIAIGDLGVTHDRSQKYKLLKPFYKTFNVLVVPEDFMKNVKSEKSLIERIKAWF